MLSPGQSRFLGKQEFSGCSICFVALNSHHRYICHALSLSTALLNAKTPKWKLLWCLLSEYWVTCCTFITLFQLFALKIIIFFISFYCVCILSGPRCEGGWAAEHPELFVNNAWGTWQSISALSEFTQCVGVPLCCTKLQGHISFSCYSRGSLFFFPAFKLITKMT